MRPTPLRVAWVPWGLPSALGLAHALSDGAAGWLLASCGSRESPAAVAWLLLAYNALAFGAQPLAGWVLDRSGRYRLATSAALGAMAAAAALGPSLPALAIVLAGAASCLFHVGAGALAAQACGDRAGPLGAFAGPGVLGLMLGGAAGAASWPGLPVAAALLAGAVLLARTTLREPLTPSPPRPGEVPWETHDAVMVVLLAAVALRSALWTGLQFVVEGNLPVLALLAVAAAAGKVLGGLAADRLGLRAWSLGALIVAAPLLAAGRDHLAALGLGMALLQSTTPAFLRASIRLLPRAPATASGLVLGLALALGGLPSMVGLAPEVARPPTLALGALAAAVLAAGALRAPRQGGVEAPA